MTGCGSDAGPDGMVVHVDSSGVRVVEYMQLDTSRVWRVGTEPVLSIGQVEGEEPYLFTWASRIQRFEDGRILVVEGREAEIRVFDPDGTFLDQIGEGQGEGPGEFSWVDWADLVRGDSVLVWDSQMRRISVFSDQGELGRVTSPTYPEGVVFLLGEGAFPDGMLLVRPAGARRPLAPGSIVHDTMTYARWDPVEGDSLVPLVRVPTASVYLDQESRYWPIPFAASPSVALDSAGVYSTDGSDFTFDRHLLDGRRALRVRVEHPRMPVGADTVQAYQQERLEGAEEPAARAALRERFEELPFADSYPVIERLLVDHAGNLWVGLHDPSDEAPGSWHVFDSEGVHQAYVETPAGFDVHDIHQDAILGRWQDEMGVRTVRVYALERS